VLVIERENAVVMLAKAASSPATPCGPEDHRNGTHDFGIVMAGLDPAIHGAPQTDVNAWRTMATLVSYAASSDARPSRN
jgi:hypothetical protein